jgi:hypothetical protein
VYSYQTIRVKRNQSSRFDLDPVEAVMRGGSQKMPIQ